MRTIRVSSVGLHVGWRAEKRRGEAACFTGQTWIEIRGESDEPLREVRDFVVSLHPDDRTEPGPNIPPSVGAILQLQPVVRAVVGLESASFERVWTLASSNQLRYCWLAFTEPVRRSALIVSTTFSSEEEE